jgi:hypothetical protein
MHHAENKMDMAYFKGVPFTAEAASLPGYTFREWTVTGRTHQRMALITKEDTWQYFDQPGQPLGDWTSI